MRIIKSFLFLFLLLFSSYSYSIFYDTYQVALDKCLLQANTDPELSCEIDAQQLGDVHFHWLFYFKNGSKRVVTSYSYRICPPPSFWDYASQQCVLPKYCHDYSFDPISFVDRGRGFCPQADASSCIRQEDNISYSIPTCTDANAPACADVGYNPNGFDTGSGFCPNGDGSAPKGCLGLDGGYFSIPPCTLAQCPDGSQVDTALNQTCALPSQCWDGSIVFLSNGGQCPSPPFICPDGTKVAKQSNCPTPDEEMYLCQDGTSVAISELCVTKVDTLCSDGSIASSGTDCPTPSPIGNPDTICQDGTKVQDAADCPPVFIFQPDVKDTATSTTNNTTVTTTTVNGVTTSTTQTSTQETTIELNLDGVNARLDQGNINTREIADNTREMADLLKDESTGTGLSIYDRSGKTVSGAMTAFYDDLQNSSLYVSVSSIFDLTPVASSCPVWTVPSVMGFDAITFDYLCTPLAQNLFSIVYGVLLLIATLMAIRLMLG